MHVPEDRPLGGDPRVNSTERIRCLSRRRRRAARTPQRKRRPSRCFDEIDEMARRREKNERDGGDIDKKLKTRGRPTAPKAEGERGKEEAKRRRAGGDADAEDAALG